jgi:hypothetical protein
MRPARNITVETVRVRPPEGDWILSEVERGYTARCGDAVLYTVNSRKPRVFRTLDTAVRKLRDEIGVTKFEVIVKDTA